MSSNKEVRIITILFSLSLVLIASAFLTIKGTFAKVEVNVLTKEEFLAYQEELGRVKSIACRLLDDFCSCP